MIENVDSFLYLVSQFLITALPVAVVIAVVFFVLGRASGKRSEKLRSDHAQTARKLAEASASRKELSARLDQSESARRSLATRLDEDTRQGQGDLSALEEQLAKSESALAQSRRQLEEQRDSIHGGDAFPEKGFWRLVSSENGREAASLTHRLHETERRFQDQSREAQALKERIATAAAALQGEDTQEA
jgi:hypothetical protein